MTVSNQENTAIFDGSVVLTRGRLVVHSDHDYRIPVTQGIGAFTALQRRGIPSEFLHYPDESHWVQKPQNSVLWHDTVNGWLKQHLGQ